MKLIKLTAIPLFFGLFISFTSCEKNSEKKIQTDFSKQGIVLSGAQEPQIPCPNTSSALGTMDVFYSRETRTLTYSVTWSGLAAPVSAMHIHGLAPVGFSTSVFQNIITTGAGTGLFVPGPTFGTSGKVSGSLFIDGVTIKEADLLNGFYYMNIHNNGLNPNCVGATYSGGEIRGQIRFQ